jgi:hypothetical protein
MPVRFQQVQNSNSFYFTTSLAISGFSYPSPDRTIDIQVLTKVALPLLNCELVLALLFFNHNQ